MQFLSGLLTIDEMGKMLDVDVSDIHCLVDSNLISLTDGGKCDIVTFIQFLLMRDLLALNIDDEILNHISEIVEGRAFFDDNIGAIPFVVTYNHMPSKYIRIMVMPYRDVVVEVSTFQLKKYTSLQHGEVELPYAEDAPTWANLQPCTLLIYLDWYVEKWKQFFTIHRAPDTIKVKFNPIR